MGLVSSTQSAIPIIQAAGAKNPDENVVVIPVDGSKQAELAFNFYAKYVHKVGNTVHIVHSEEVQCPAGGFYPDYVIPPEEWKGRIDAAKSEGETLMATYEEKMKSLKMTGQTHCQIGPPGHVIISSAHSLKANQIVMGTRGMGMLRRTILGSVSDYVIHHTNIPVTIVPGEEEHHEYKQGFPR